MSKKKKSVAALGAAIAEHEKKTDNAPSPAVQQLVEAYLSTNNPAKRAKRIAEIKQRCEGGKRPADGKQRAARRRGGTGAAKGGDRIHSHRTQGAAGQRR